jgi:hypothetical protein
VRLEQYAARQGVTVRADGTHLNDDLTRQCQSGRASHKRRSAVLRLAVESVFEMLHRSFPVLVARREVFRHNADAGRQVRDSHSAVVDAPAIGVDHKILGADLHPRRSCASSARFSRYVFGAKSCLGGYRG